MPAYLTNENLRFNSTLDSCVVVSTSGANKNVIRWDMLMSEGQALFDAFVVAIGGTLPVVAYSGYQIVNFNGTVVGANPSGLKNDATVYHANVVVDGTNHPISVTGSTAQTFTLVVAALNTALGVAATAAIVGGNIKITSASTGNVSTVLVETGQQDVDNSLFRTLTSMKTFQTPINGATGLTEAMQLNYVPLSTSLNYTNDFSNGETYFNLWRGLIQFLPPKPVFTTIGAGGDGFSDTAVAWYDPAGGGARSWRYLITDAVANPPPA